MDLTEAVTADRLWGWPVGLLDRLLELHQQAWAGAVPVEAWRAQDAELRSGQPDVDAEEVGAALTDWVGSGQLDLRTHGQLLGRLTMLANRPPTDDDLWADLVELAARATPESSGARAAVDRERQDRIAGWLARPGSGIDAVTGLPSSSIAQRGEPVDRARQEALDAATDVERHCAGLLLARRSDTGAS